MARRAARTATSLQPTHQAGGAGCALRRRIALWNDQSNHRRCSIYAPADLKHHRPTASSTLHPGHISPAEGAGGSAALASWLSQVHARDDRTDCAATAHGDTARGNLRTTTPTPVEKSRGRMRSTLYRAPIHSKPDHAISAQRVSPLTPPDVQASQICPRRAS